MGARFWNLTGNEFGKIDGLSAEGSACIHLTSNDGTAGTVGANGNIVSSNQFHNIGQAGGNACAVFASHNNGLRIVGCQGNLLSSPLVELSDSCRDTSIDSTTALMAQDKEALKVSFATTGLRVRGMDVGKDDGSDVAAANVFFSPPPSSPGNVIDAVNVDFSDCVFRSNSVGVRFQFGSTNQPVRFSNCRNDGSGALQVNADVGTGTGSSVSGLFDGLTGDDPDNAALIENLTTNAS